MIIIRAGDTPSLEWELQQTRLLARPDKVLICFPRDAFGNYETSLERVLKPIESGLELKIDYPEGTPMIIGFDSRWNPHFYKAKSISFIGGILSLHASTLIRTLSLALKDRGLPFRRVPPLTIIIRPLVYSAFYIALLALAISTPLCFWLLASRVIIFDAGTLNLGYAFLLCVPKTRFGVDACSEQRKIATR